MLSIIHKGWGKEWNTAVYRPKYLYNPIFQKCIYKAVSLYNIRKIFVKHFAFIYNLHNIKNKVVIFNSEIYLSEPCLVCSCIEKSTGSRSICGKFNMISYNSAASKALSDQSWRSEEVQSLLRQPSHSIFPVQAQIRDSLLRQIIYIILIVVVRHCLCAQVSFYLLLHFIYYYAMRVQSKKRWIVSYFRERSPPTTLLYTYTYISLLLLLQSNIFYIVVWCNKIISRSYFV